MHRVYIEKTCTPKESDRMSEVEFFKSDDFYCYGMSKDNSILATNRANLLLKERGAVVYGSSQDGLTSLQSLGFSFNQEDEDTHQALLINIRPIEKPKRTMEDLVKELIGIAHKGFYSESLHKRLVELSKEAEEILSLEK